MQLPFTGERYVPELRGQIYYEHVHRYALAFQMARDLDVLDIASGEGYGAAYLAIVARSVVGVDIDSESVRHAAARYTAMNLSFRTGSCTRIPMPDESVDLAVSFETIEHIEEHEEFVRELARVLRPDGRLLISSPNKLVYSDEAQFRNPYHAKELYFDEFRDLLQSTFPYCRIYGQRIIATSAIHPLRGTARDARYVGPSPHADERGLPALPAPVYFVALCSRSEDDREEAFESLDSVFVDPRDDLLQDIVHPELHLTQPSGVRAEPLELAGATEPQDVAALPAPAAAVDTAPSQGGPPAADEAHLAEIADLRAALAAERERAAAEAQHAAEAASHTAVLLQEALADRDASLRRAEGSEREAVRLQAHVTQAEHDRSQEIQALRASAEDAENRSAAAADRASVLEQNVAAAESRAGSAAEECRSLQRCVDDLRSALRDAGVRGDALQADLARARAEAMQSRVQIDAIVHSTSWRMTKPFRQALQQFRRGT